MVKPTMAKLTMNKVNMVKLTMNKMNLVKINISEIIVHWNKFIGIYIYIYEIKLFFNLKIKYDVGNI